MEIVQIYKADFGRMEAFKSFLESMGLFYEEPVEVLYAVYDHGEIVATGGMFKNVIKMMAVHPEYRNSGIIGRMSSKLVYEGILAGQNHLFIYTKPMYIQTFEHLGFYQVCVTEHVALLESKKDGINIYIEGLQREQGVQKESGIAGAVVMNCNPFTLGHQYLIEQASGRVDWLHIFVVHEDCSVFSYAVRKRLLMEGTRHLSNVVVHHTGPYVVSQATFPAYFLGHAGRQAVVQTQLDAQLFGEKIGRALSIKRRFLGEEPCSQVTQRYNEMLSKVLIRYGIAVEIIERKRIWGEPISASRVRQLLKVEDFKTVRSLVPSSTYEFLMSPEAKTSIEKIKNTG